MKSGLPKPSGIMYVSIKGSHISAWARGSMGKLLQAECKPDCGSVGLWDKVRGGLRTMGTRNKGEQDLQEV